MKANHPTKCQHAKGNQTIQIHFYEGKFTLEFRCTRTQAKNINLNSIKCSTIHNYKKTGHVDPTITKY